MKTTRLLRTARAGAFSVVCLGVSAAGHIWVSGRPIPVTVLVPGFVLVFTLALAGSRRPRGFAPIAALMLACQAGLRLLFADAQHRGAAGAMPGLPAIGMRLYLPGAIPVTAIAEHSTTGMVLVHAAVGLASAWWLYGGERAVFALLSQMLHEAATLLPSSGSGTASRRLAGHARQHWAPGLLRLGLYPAPLVHVLVRRGPPQVGSTD